LVQLAGDILTQKASTKGLFYGARYAVRSKQGKQIVFLQRNSGFETLEPCNPPPLQGGARGGFAQEADYSFVARLAPPLKNGGSSGILVADSSRY
jgi:hypothetical protein